MDKLALAAKLTYLWAAEQILREQKRPMRVQDIVAQAQDSGLFSEEMYSRTPQKSMQARLSLEIVRNGQNSTFVRTGKGVFFLRDLLDGNITANEQAGGLGLKPAEILTQYDAAPRRPRQTTEKVLVVPSEACASILDFQGLKTGTEAHLERLIGSNIAHVARTEAEETEAFKQVITYVLVTHRQQVLCFRRGRFNRAARFLRGQLCIGFGGHVTEDDITLFSKGDCGIRHNAAREVAEEVKVEGLAPAVRSEDLNFIGIVNDNSTPLGRKHLAVVFQYEVPAADWQKWRAASKHEMSINELRWIDTESDPINLVEFEYWSQLCWRTLSPEIVEAQAEYRILRKKPFRKPHILIVAGGIGSGKSAATKVLVRRYGYSAINSGRVLAGLLGLPPVPETPRNEFQHRAWDFITRPDGPEVLARALLDAAENTGSKYVIIDGIRQQSTLDALRCKASGALALLFVYATPDLALRLVCKREGKVESEYERQFFKAIGAEVESDVQYLMNSADAVIYNWSGEANYEKALSQMANKLGMKARG